MIKIDNESGRVPTRSLRVTADSRKRYAARSQATPVTDHPTQPAMPRYGFSERFHGELKLSSRPGAGRVENVAPPSRLERIRPRYLPGFANA